MAIKKNKSRGHGRQYIIYITYMYIDRATKAVQTILVTVITIEQEITLIIIINTITEMNVMKNKPIYNVHINYRV